MMVMVVSARYPSLNAWIVAALILVVTGLLYGHTLHAPFYLDDQWAIVERYPLRDLPAAFLGLLGQRGLTNLTFAINYRLTGLSLTALHLTNIALHGCCGFLSWLLMRRLLQCSYLALLGALLFVVHPLQTQAVTYLVQRATVLGTLFFMLAFWCHLRAREALDEGGRCYSGRHLWFWLGAILAGGYAVLAKENTATLPLVLFVYDRLFSLPKGRNLRRALGYYLPFFLVPIAVGASVVADILASGGTEALYTPLVSMQHNGPANYLVTQFSVIWIYLRLLIIPYGQALEHNYPVAADLLTAQSVLALTGLMVIGWSAWRMRDRSPLLVFGVVWFFLGLAIESSVIPLDPLFEHRLYLPMFGFVIVLLAGLSLVLQKKLVLLVFGGMILCYAPVTWWRNALWNDAITLYQDNLRVVPTSERAGEHLASLYSAAGRFNEELQLLKEMSRLYPDNLVLRDNLAKAYGEIFRFDEAYAQLEEGMRRQPKAAVFYETAAALATLQKNRQLAVDYLRRGLAVHGADRGRLLNDLGVLHSEAGETSAAEDAFANSLNEDDRDARVWLNLGKEYYIQGRWEKASATFEKSLLLEPGNPEALEGLGRSALQSGESDIARWAAGKLKYADRQAWQRLQAMILPTQAR